MPCCEFIRPEKKWHHLPTDVPPAFAEPAFITLEVESNGTWPHFSTRLGACKNRTRRTRHGGDPRSAHRPRGVFPDGGKTRHARRRVQSSVCRTAGPRRPVLRQSVRLRVRRNHRVE